MYTAPAVECGSTEEIVLTLTVTDSCGASASDSLGVHVNAVNHPPVTDAGEDVTISECTSIQLTCSASDPDGDPLTYYWTAAGGHGSFDNPCVLHPMYTAPAVDDCKAKDIVFLTLMVTDSHGATASDSLVVYVNKNKVSPLRCQVAPAPCPPQPTPPCTPLPPYCPPTPAPCAPTPPSPPCITPCSVKSVDEGGSIQLHGKVWDPDCNLVSFCWTADKGTFSDPVLPDPVYCAPMTDRCGGEDVRITLTAVDSCGAKGSDSFILRVNNVNQPPVADAGPDMVIPACSRAQPTCFAYDPDGDPLTYCWTAECGRGTFDDPTLLHPCYTAPPTDRCEGEDIVLTLTVTDSQGLSSSDSIVVHVIGPNSSPCIRG